MITNPAQESTPSEPRENYGEDDVTCPACEYVIGDSWEIQADYGEEECGRCGVKYSWERVTDITYQAKEIPLK